MSIINIGVLTYKDEQFGVRDSFEDFLQTNYNNSMKEFLRDRKKLAQHQKVEILLAGRVDVPSISCPKELLDQEMKERMIPIVIKKPVGTAALTSSAAASKFRLPFKNNGTQELEVEFSFAKTSAVICGPLLGNDGETVNSPLEFSIGPGGNTLKLPANGGLNNLNLTAKFKNSYQLLCLKAEKLSLQSTNDSSDNSSKKNSNKRQQSEKYTHLLVGKVKDS